MARSTLLSSLPLAICATFAAAALALGATQSATPPATPPAAPATAAPSAPPAEAPPAKKLSAKARVKDVKAVTGTILTAGKEVKFELHVQKTPTLCANFAFLAQRGFWDGQTWTGFTRVVRQGGPNIVGYPLPREFAPDLNFDDPAGGNLCMSKMSDKVSDAANAVHFFITIKQQERWNLDFQIFGKVTSGLDVITNLTEGTKIDKITVEGDVEGLLKAFEAETQQWAAKLAELESAPRFATGTLPGTPDRRTGKVLPNREIDGTPTGVTPKE